MSVSFLDQIHWCPFLGFCQKLWLHKDISGPDFVLVSCPRHYSVLECFLFPIENLTLKIVSNQSTKSATLTPLFIHIRLKTAFAPYCTSLEIEFPTPYFSY